MELYFSLIWNHPILLKSFYGANEIIVITNFLKIRLDEADQRG